MWLNFSCWPMFAHKCFTYSKVLYTSAIEAAILETGIHWFLGKVQSSMREVATILNTVVHEQASLTFSIRTCVLAFLKL